jgi:hypothetical protein
MNLEFNPLVEIPVTRATYYLPREEVLDPSAGIVKLRVTHLSVDYDVESNGCVTLVAAARRDDAYGYEFDLVAPAARLLAAQLLAAADATGDLG